MLCIACIKAGILFALKEHSIVNILLNSLSLNFLAWIFSPLTEVSFSCYAYDLLILSWMVRCKFLFSMHVTAICYKQAINILMGTYVTMHMHTYISP